MNCRFLLSFFILFYFVHISIVPLLGQDTTFSEVIELPFTIRSMVNDAEGKIYMETSVGLYQFDGSKYWELDKSYDKGALVIRNGKLTNINEVFKKEGTYINDLNKNGVWLHFLPANSSRNISFATDNKNNSWVASGNKLYKVEVRKNFEKLLDGISTRNILWIGSDIYVCSYSGIFKNGEKVFPEIWYAEGINFDLSSRNIYIASERDIFIFSIKHNKLLKFNFENDLPDYGLILNVAFFKGKKWVIASSGLIDFDQRKKGIIKLDINDTHIIDNEFFISAKDGVYKFDGKSLSKFLNLPSIETNSMVKIGEFFWVSTKQGVYVYSNKNKKTEKIIFNETYPDLEAYAVQRDNNGYFWISTAAGLYRYNKFITKSDVFFPGLEFNKRSFISHNGIFYFGSINGLVSFNPLDFSEEFNDKSTANQFIIFILVFLIFLILGVFFLFRFKFSKQVKKKLDIIFKDEKDEFLFGLGEFILQNLNFVSVDDLIVFSGMKKRTFYRKLDTDYNLTPNQLIQILKEKKARKLIKENPDIQMDIIAKNTGFSISNLYLILKEEENHPTGNVEILNSLRY